jgi:hypothetical protein
MFHSLLMVRIISNVSGRIRFNISAIPPNQLGELGLRLTHGVNREVPNVHGIAVGHCEALVFVRLDKRRQNRETVAISVPGAGSASK